MMDFAMLWSDPSVELPNNYNPALAQYKSLSARFDRDPVL